MNKFRQLRKAKNISQSTLAERLGVSQTAVSQWETNKNYPDVNTIKELAEIYAVTTDYLLNVDSKRLKKDGEIVVYNSVPRGIEWANIQDKYGYEELGSKYTDTGKEFVGFRITSNDYNPIFLPNDILIIEVRNNCDSGDYALVQSHYNNAEVKRIFYKSNGILAQPVSYQDGEGEFFVTNSRDRLTILGVVREVRRTIKEDN